MAPRNRALFIPVIPALVSWPTLVSSLVVIARSESADMNRKLSDLFDSRKGSAAGATEIPFLMGQVSSVDRCAF